ncbi:MAG TPA: hypothetical protein VFT36_00380 [Methylomirabilota bacterium]|nr:hypothetical protein [Methylomirabilota bacterium]
MSFDCYTSRGGATSARKRRKDRQAQLDALRRAGQRPGGVRWWNAEAKEEWRGRGQRK